MYMLLSILMILLLAGCSKTDQEKQGTKFGIYYINNIDTKVVKENYTLRSNNLNDQIKELIGKLKDNPKTSGYKKTIPDNVSEPETKYNEETKCLMLYFNTTYASIQGIQELLRRAAIVKTLCQLDGVEDVQFYVAGQPLMEGDNKNVGLMDSSKFIDNTDRNFNYIQTQQLRLYYADKHGDKLEETSVEVGNDQSQEKWIMDLLIEGPDRIVNLKQELLPTVPEGTEYKKISISNATCYVDFNEAFLEKREKVTDEVALYSVVNSLCEITNVTKVQITVNGEILKTYGKLTDLPAMLEPNYKLIQE